MTGLFQPFRDGADARFALDAFRGLPIAGTWTLRITDSEEGEAGVLRGWGIDAPQQDCGGRLELPQAQTAAASAVGRRSATLHGAVTPNGRQTGLRFAFGTSAAYGETSPVTSAGDGDAPPPGGAPPAGDPPGRGAPLDRTRPAIRGAGVKLAKAPGSAGHGRAQAGGTTDAPPSIRAGQGCLHRDADRRRRRRRRVAGRAFPNQVGGGADGPRRRVVEFPSP